MATPQSTPHPPLHPNSASKKNTNPSVHTPAGPASAPRSVPSPAAIRASGKTPAGAGNVKMGGTPMGLSLSSLGMSPSGFTPGMSGLPIAGFTPNSSSSVPGGMMMMPSMSDLGLSASSSKRSGVDGEYERKRKMRSVLRKIGGRSAGVGEEGICRVSRRVGLANDVDAEGEEARREREGERGISIAGRDVLIDVDMKGNRAQGVIVAGMGGVGQGEMGKAGKVLERLLVEGEGDLEGFGRELGRIAGLDRVGERGVSAFEAVSGVGGCLERLWRKECEGEDDEGKVLRKRSGRPWMHSRGRIGLGVDYWTTAPAAPPKDDNAMDVDQKQEQKEDRSGFLTLHITAEGCPAAMYPSVRISTNWLPEDLSTPKNENETTNTTPAFQIPWQDPPPTYTTPLEDESSVPESQQHQSKLPDIRFMAKLDPPLIIPYPVASRLLEEMGGEGVQGMVMFREWHLMLASEAAKTNSGSTASTTTVDAMNQDALLRASGLHGSAAVQGRNGGEVKHTYTLDVTKAEWGYRLTELPFAHPRQVVELLPLLRQWGVFGRIVKSLLSPSSRSSSMNDAGGVQGHKSAAVVVKKESEDEDDVLLDSLLLTPPPSEAGEQGEEREQDDVRVHVEICTSPQPTLSVSFPIKDREKGRSRGRTGRIVLQVGRNADFRVEFLEGFVGEVGGEEEGDVIVGERISKGLEVCGGDVGVWVEWIRGGGGRERGRASEGQVKGK